MMGWLKELELGKDRKEILGGFIYSSEFVELCLNYGIKAFRDPDYDFDGDGMQKARETAVKSIRQHIPEQKISAADGW